MGNHLNQFLFGIYPYICLSVFLIGSLIRFDRGQFTWRSGSSQLLRTRQLKWGSNLFHVGILFLFAGHFVGLLTPHWIYEHFISASSKQMLAVVSGGVAGAICFVGLTLLLHRRLLDPRIRITSSTMDIAILVVLWFQLVLGLLTLPFSLQHSDGSVMIVLSEWAQRILTLRSGAADLIRDVAWAYKLHLVLGLTIFLLFPFSRLVHIWSAPVGYVFRSYQVVRRRGA
jgi:nitrate reductase gamma subunit